jgi:hypothetical protein
MKDSRVARIVLTLAAIASWLTVSAAAASPDTRDAVKAALILNFARFSEWPAGADGPVIFCVAGDRPLEDVLTETVRGQSVNGRAIEVVHPSSAADAARCHVLYVNPSAQPLVDSVRNLPVLTVSDSPRFASNGGVIELIVDQGRMRFAVNVDVASRCGLKLSSRFLSLARIVTD